MRLVYFSFLLCMILLCSISCNDLNGVVDCVGDGSDDGSFIQSSIMCSYLTCKIRFEVSRRQRRRVWMEKEDALPVNARFRSNLDVICE